jgi:ATP-dependent DNA helicase
VAAYLTIIDNKFSKRRNLILMAPYEHNLLVKSIPGYSWSKENKGWSFPLGEGMINDIRLMMNLHNVSYMENNLIDIYLDEERAKRESVRDILTNEEVQLNVPYSDKLRDYQRTGVAFILQVGNALLGDDPGLGKTLQGITVCELVDKSKGVLILCPTGARMGWYDEITKWTNSSAIVVKGAKSKTKIKRMNEEVDYKIMNFELARYYSEYILSKEWSAIIVDEAHYIKNKKTIMFDVLSRVKADRKLFMTANPMMNHVYDLWAILNLLYPDRYPNYWAFVTKYCNMDVNNFGSSPTGTRKDMIPELQRELATIMIRREKGNVLHELPPKIYQSSLLEMSKDHRKIYDQLLEQKRINLMSSVNIMEGLDKFSLDTTTADKVVYHCTQEQKVKILNAYNGMIYNIQGTNYLEISRSVLAFRLSDKKYAICSYDESDQLATAITMRGGITVSNMLEQTTRERQLLVSPQLIDKNLPSYAPKMDAIMDDLGDVIKEGRKVIIMSQWTRSFDVFEQLLKKANIPFLEFSGRQSANKNDEHKKMFVEDDKHYVMLLSIISGGVALNLQRASVGYRLDKHYNPFVNIQAEDRMHRMGQQDSVVIQDFVMEDTIEHKIEELLKQRKEDYDLVMDQKDILELLK